MNVRIIEWNQFQIKIQKIVRNLEVYIRCCTFVENANKHQTKSLHSVTLFSCLEF